MTVPRRYDLFGQDFQTNLHDTLARMRSHDPVLYQGSIDGSGAYWVLTRYRDVERMLKDEDTFTRDPAKAGVDIPYDATERKIAQHMLNASGDDHRRLRTLVQQAFTPRRVTELAPFVQQVADDLLHEEVPRGRMDVISDYAFPLPTRVILELLGIPHQDRDRFRAWSEAFFTPALDPATASDHRSRIAAFVDYLAVLFEERRYAPQDDLVSDLLRAEEAGDRLSEDEVYSTVVLLIVAGHETTVNLLANGLLALQRNPEARTAFETAVAEDDHDTMSATVEEVLRFDGPVIRALIRWATRDVTIDGHTIRRGQPLFGYLASANRDADRFANPDAFDPRRPDLKAHLGLGKGIHYCLGAPLARLEGRIGLASFVRALPGWRLELPSDGVPPYRAQPGMRSPATLPARW